MSTLRVCVVAVLLVSLSCGGGTPPPQSLSSTWAAPAILAHVPAESPYLIASLAPTSEQVRRRMFGGLNYQLSEALRAIEGLRATGNEVVKPWMRAIFAIAEELRGKDVSSWAQELGFEPDGRFAFYGLSLWPVLRIQVANPTRLRSIVERALSAAQVQLRQEVHDGRRYWIAGDDRFSIIAAVLEREAVAAFVPTSTLASALPLVLGTRTPARSLSATTTVSDLLQRHHLLGVVLAYIDARNAVDIVTGSRPSELDGPLRTWLGPVPPACRTDLERIASVSPRLVIGYRRVDDVGYDGHAILETSTALARALGKLRTAVPELTARSSGNPLFAFGAAVDPAEVVAWLRGVATQLRDQPFGCAWLTGINQAARELAGKLATPLPPMLHGLHGFALTVDTATANPFDVNGHLIVAGERVADMVSSLTGTLPVLAGVPLKHDGRPIAIPTQQLGIPLRSAHLAMTADRLVIASGTDSQQRVTAHLATPVPGKSPLMMMAFDAPRLQQLLVSLGRDGFENSLAEVGQVAMSLDVADAGVVLSVSGTWPPPRTQQTPQP